MNDPTLYYGIVQSVDIGKGQLWVTIEELGGPDHLFGPLPLIGSLYRWPEFALDYRLEHSHTANVEVDGEIDIPVGSLVLVGQVGLVPEDLVVLGQALVWGGTSG